MLASYDCDVAVDTPISANAQSARSNVFTVPGVAVSPRIQSPQSGFAGQAGSTDGCAVETLAPASRHNKSVS